MNAPSYATSAFEIKRECALTNGFERSWLMLHTRRYILSGLTSTENYNLIYLVNNLDIEETAMQVSFFFQGYIE